MYCGYNQNTLNCRLVPYLRVVQQRSGLVDEANVELYLVTSLIYSSREVREVDLVSSCPSRPDANNFVAIEMEKHWAARTGFVSLEK